MIHRQTFPSLETFASESLAALNANEERRQSFNDHYPPERADWMGVPNLEAACELARTGWEDGLADVLPIIESALRTIDQDHHVTTFSAFHDVSGCEVDVSRFLAGIPESMVEYEPTVISRVGKVVTLCASTCYSGALSVPTVLRRGATIVGLALALEQTGHAVEIWADMTVRGLGGAHSSHVTTIRVCVKGAHDVCDPSKIAYALGHPSMLRQLAFAQWSSDMTPTIIRKAIRSGDYGNSYGYPTDPDKDLPEGTIHVRSLESAVDLDDPERFIVATLTELGLLDQ